VLNDCVTEMKVRSFRSNTSASLAKSLRDQFEMAKLLLAKQDIIDRLGKKLDGLFLTDPSFIRPDVWRISRLTPDEPNWDCSFTGVPEEDLRIVQSAADLLRREIDLK
jgi:hypothetical protein